MRDIMFDIPSNPKIEKCIITKDVVLNGSEPQVIINENKVAKKHIKKAKILASEEQDNQETA